MVVEGLILGGRHHQGEVDAAEKVYFQTVELQNRQIGASCVEFRFETDFIEELLGQNHSTLNRTIKEDDAVITFFIDEFAMSP